MEADVENEVSGQIPLHGPSPLPRGEHSMCGMRCLDSSAASWSPVELRLPTALSSAVA